MEELNSLLPINIPTADPHIIKVIGVGGGGSNAVKNMYREGIHDVTFVLCNTDRQALASSDIPIKIQLGRETTKGLGAGNDPEVARLAAEESIEDIRALFRDDTQMVFITAGMGGGTGTGAAPVVARVAKEMDILTVGIVTIPFKFERQRKIIQALKGVEAIARNVDALLVINNERLLETYPNLPVKEGFRMVDETLTVATRSIAEIITVEGIMNLDFRDVSKILKDGGVAIMACGKGAGEKRLDAAIRDALNSPLLNDNDIYNSRKILFNIYQSQKKPLIVEEFEELNRFMEKFESNDIEVIWGVADDDTLEEDVKITILASGFGMANIPGMEQAIRQRQQKQDLESERQRLEREEADRQMVEKFYGGSRYQKRVVRSFILQDAHLDDDALISAIESSPTWRRTTTELEDLKASANKHIQI
ncbi:MAG: cell division protein FtsZ, partial [Bacteroidaceae bacterium]|nr:cell division protein FtsZ [Bacteroidaceae bacterium]